MDAAQQLLVMLAALLGVVVTVGGAIWWLVVPRIKAGVATIVAEQRQQTMQLADVNTRGTVAYSARIAADAAAQLPQLRRTVDQLVTDSHTWREIAERLNTVDVLQDNLHGRVGSLEQAMIAYLGGSLAEAIAEQKASSYQRREQQARADWIRDERE